MAQSSIRCEALIDPNIVRAEHFFAVHLYNTHLKEDLGVYCGHDYKNHEVYFHFEEEHICQSQKFRLYSFFFSLQFTFLEGLQHKILLSFMLWL